MAGVKGRSGPPGNMHGARHGVTSWLRRRALPVHKQHVAQMIEDYRDALLVCKGGKEGATEVEVALVENASRAYGASLLILEEGKARGLVREVDGSWDLAPGLTRLTGFLNAERTALLGLGLARREKAVPSLQEWLEARAAAAEAQGDTDTPEDPAQEGAEVPPVADPDLTSMGDTPDAP